jgi:hypothetical protein
MKYSRIVFTFLFLGILITPQNAYSQEFEVDLSLLNPGAVVLPVGELDLLNTGVTQPLFSVVVTSLSSSAVNAQLELKILKDGVQIIKAESNVVEFPGNYTLTVTNNQLNQGVMIPNSQGEPQELELRIRDNNINYSAVANLEQALQTTGFMPAGQYNFVLTLIRVADGARINDNNPDNNVLYISNPTSIILQFPGRSTAESDIEEVNTIFPFFQWYADAVAGGIRYNIYVYEKLPEHRTVQDVLNYTPILQVEDYGLNFFQYPTDSDPTLLSGKVVGAVRLLQPGKIYYWTVEMVVPTSTTEIVIPSDVYRFRVAESVQNVVFTPQILIFLRQILGPEKEGVLQSLIDGGFEPTGTITLDGTEISISELLIMLSQLQSGSLKIRKVEVY